MKPKNTSLETLLNIFLIFPTSAVVLAEHAHDIPELIVPGHTVEEFTHVEINSDVRGLASTDAARLMTYVPGGNLNDNGPLSGQPQYRGLFGPRINVRLDGMYINSGGPNWMDPPLHYMPTSLLDSIEITRGIASVSTGPGIGGNVQARYKTSDFTEGSDFEFHGSLNANAHSVDEGYNLGGVLAFSNNTHRFHASASRDDGNERDSGNGTIAATEYERNFGGFGYGFRIDEHEFSIDYRIDDTNDAGNPVLPLDIALFNTDLLNANYKGVWGEFEVRTNINYSSIDHRMTNFRLRPAPDFSSLPLPPFVGTDRRFVNAESEGLGYSLDLSRALWGGTASFGVDGHRAKHDAVVSDPDVAPFFVTNFNNAEIDHYGFFGEWRGEIQSKFNLELGIRYNRVEAQTDEVNAQPANLPLAQVLGTPPFAVRMLRDRFNVSDRNHSDDNVDWVAKLGYEYAEGLSFELGFARKTRSPSYLERYLWIPLEVNAGLGDGNNYVGNVDLDPEISHQVETAFYWHSDKAYLTPRAFYRRVDDYIQGVPIAATTPPATDFFIRAVSGNANGDPNPLQFANVDAEIYGLDAMYGFRVNDYWRVDGMFSYTRGKRRDINDDLYRIAPLNTRLSLSYEAEDWSATLEGLAYARQDKISQTITTNSSVGTNAETPGYALLNIYGQYRLADSGLRLHAGVENLLDKHYIDHLSGFNRVQGSDVPVGQRITGTGRNVYMTVNYDW